MRRILLFALLFTAPLTFLSASEPLPSGFDDAVQQYRTWAEVDSLCTATLFQPDAAIPLKLQAYELLSEINPGRAQAVLDSLPVDRQSGLEFIDCLRAAGARNPAEARRLAKASIARDPEDLCGYMALFDAWKRIAESFDPVLGPDRDQRKALVQDLASLRWLRERFPNRRDIAWMIAEASIASGDVDRALELSSNLCSEAMRRQGCLLHVRTLVAAGQDKEALEILEQRSGITGDAPRITPISRDARLVLGRMMVAADHVRDAKRLVKRQDNWRNDGDMLYLMAFVEKAEGNGDKALTWLEEASRHGFADREALAHDFPYGVGSHQSALGVVYTRTNTNASLQDSDGASDLDTFATPRELPALWITLPNDTVLWLSDLDNRPTVLFFISEAFLAGQDDPFSLLDVNVDHLVDEQARILVVDMYGTLDPSYLDLLHRKQPKARFVKGNKRLADTLGLSQVPAIAVLDGSARLRLAQGWTSGMEKALHEYLRTL